MKQEEINISDDINFEEQEISSKPEKIDSIFQSVIIACLRQKQLNKGAHPRIVVPSLKTKNTRIAIEEVNEGLILYTALT